MDIGGFVKKIVGASWEGSGIDGGEIHDLALSHGLIVKTVYDPKKHGNGGLEYCDAGDDWYVFSPEFARMFGE